jgi:predicted aspartyl protease
MRLSALIRFLCAVLCVSTLAALAALGFPTAPDYKHLYETHQWFALRDAIVAAGEHAPVFYKAAVEAAFNQTEAADRDLRTDMRGEPRSPRARESREHLIALYYRQGKYKSALTAFDAYHYTAANSDEKSEREMLAAFATAGDLTVSTPKPSASVKIEVVDNNLFLPVTLNNSLASYAFDNGASVSMMSESEAKRLGLTVTSTTASLDSMTGAKIPARIAVVNDLAIGGMHFSHVVFDVAPDTNPPFDDLPAGKRGIIGLPVLIAMRTQRWNAAKLIFDFDFPSAPGSEAPPPSATGAVTVPTHANLAFEDTATFLAAASNGHALICSLDTGAQHTYLYPAFAAAFPALVAGGKKETKTVTGVGGSTDFDSTVLNSVTFTIGGADVTLKPAHVLGKANNSNSAWFSANVGVDLLNQKVVTIDWSTMSITLQ